MNVIEILQFMYPDAIPLVDYQVGDDGSGQRIVSWTYAKAAQPSDADLLAKATAASVACQWSTCRETARALLDASDVTILRCYEGDVAVPAEWRSYRMALRAIVSAATGDPTQSAPVRPPFPSGS